MSPWMSVLTDKKCPKCRNQSVDHVIDKSCNQEYDECRTCGHTFNFGGMEG